MPFSKNQALTNELAKTYLNIIFSFLVDGKGTKKMSKFTIQWISGETGFGKRLGRLFSTLMVSLFFMFILLGASGVQASLNLAVEANPNPAVPNEMLTIELTVTNTSGSDRSGVVVQMPFSVGLKSLDEGAISDGGTCSYTTYSGQCDATELLSWNLGTITAGNSKTVYLSPVTSTTLANGQILEFAGTAKDYTGSSSSANTALQIGLFDDFYIAISGSTQVNESAGAQYTCMVYHSDGSTTVVTTSSSWSENSTYATISSSGYLTTSSVPSDQPCTITATYGGKSDIHDVTIKAAVFFVNKDDEAFSGNSPCYTRIQQAINEASTGTSIKISEGTYTESITLNESKSLTLQGGWNSAFTSQRPNATIIKTPKATQGSLTLQMLIIRM